LDAVYESVTYTYRRKKKPLVEIVGFFLSAALLGTAGYMQQPIWILLPFALAAVGFAVSLLRNQVHGIDLDGTLLTIIAPGGKQEIPIGSIERIEIQQWTDSDDVQIHLSDGRRIHVPSAAYGDVTRLKDALALHQVPTTMS
jgi:hypothetical protein